MTTVAFDTLKFVERLEAGGFTREQAKAAAEAFSEAAGQELATKSDLKELETKQALGFAKIEGEMTLIKWMLGILLAGVLSLVVKNFFG